MTTTLLAVGTRTGLWLATSEDRLSWSLPAPHLMTEVPSVGIDVRSGRTRLMVGVRCEHFGPTVVHSDDLGATWDEPDGGAIRFPADTGAAVERIWQLQPDSADRPGVVWAGCEPSRSGGPTTAVPPSPSTAGCGTTRTAPSGAPATAGRPRTPSSPARTPRCTWR